jgi:hypothetical protein
MTITVVWSAQARNQFVASLTYIAKEDPLTSELVHKRVSLAPSPKTQRPACLIMRPAAVGWRACRWCAR